VRLMGRWGGDDDGGLSTVRVRGAVRLSLLLSVLQSRTFVGLKLLRSHEGVDVSNGDLCDHDDRRCCRFEGAVYVRGAGGRAERALRVEFGTGVVELGPVAWPMLTWLRRGAGEGVKLGR
jgi:hypothetical protein